MKVPVLAHTSRALSIALIAAVAAISYGWWNKGKLPAPSELTQEVFQVPRQTMRPEAPFVYAYHHTAYTIEPVAAYEITGLVVSHNDIFQWGDIYHDETSVDVRDLCLVFGPTAELGAYRGVEFWSEPWSCWYRYRRGEGELFAGEDMSNTHLLARDPEVRKTLWGTRIGDQVKLTGKLINYYRTGFPEEMRRSSTVRTDTGNGACEVMLVDDVQILGRGTPGAYRLYDLGWFWLKVLLVLKVLAFLIFPHLELRYR